MMKPVKIIDGVFAIPSTGYSSNIYLLTGVVPTVIDTGLGEPKPPIEIGKILQVINTHCHFDHIGRNCLFKNARIVMHEKDAEAVRNLDNNIILSGLFGKNTICGRVDQTVSEGDVIKAGNFQLQVLHTPGHTAGSICLYEPSRKILFSGDTLFAQGFGRTDLPTGSEVEMKKSLKRLEKIEKRILLPGHGDFA